MNKELEEKMDKLAREEAMIYDGSGATGELDQGIFEISTRAFRAAMELKLEAVDEIVKVSDRILRGLNEGISTVPHSYPHLDLTKATKNFERFKNG